MVKGKHSRLSVISRGLLAFLRKRRINSLFDTLETMLSMWRFQYMSSESIMPSVFTDDTVLRNSSETSLTEETRRFYLVTIFMSKILALFKGRTMLLDQLTMLFHSTCRLSSRGWCTKWRSVTSSAYLNIVELLQEGTRLSSIIEKGRRPTTLPCGTPEDAVDYRERYSPTLVRCRVFDRKLLIQRQISLGNWKRIDASIM